MKESAVSEKKAGSVSAQRAKKAASLTRDGLGAADQPLMSIVQRAGCRDCGQSVQSLAGGMMQTPLAQRRSAAMSLQRARGNRFVQRMAVQAKREPNRTGMPDRLKAGIEALSGIDMSDVRVHANSELPARLDALAYTQGNKIYVGPGQERHLPHEAWHVVQQAQGRVRPNIRIVDVALNDDIELESEADVMGRNAAIGKPASRKPVKYINPNATLQKLGTYVEIVQRIPKITGKFLSPTPRHMDTLSAKGQPLHCPFNIKARFDLISGNTDYKYGEYRQYVKGVFRSNKVAGVHMLRNKILSQYEWNEDLGERIYIKYGYRSGGRGNFTNDKGETDRANGQFYESDDDPKALPDDDEIDLQFKGVLIDTCDNNNEVAVRQWRIFGKR